MQSKQHRATCDKWFVSISAYNSGLGLSEESIARVTERLDGLKYKTKLLANEHKNSYGQTFEHLHFYFQHDKLQSQDNVLKKYKNILKDLNLYNHKKDVNVKPATHPEILLGGYLRKDDETTVLIDTLPNNFKKQCIQSATEYSNKVCILKGRKCPSFQEAPYTIYEFINRKKLDYDQSWTSFKSILKLMLKSHEYAIGNLIGKFTKIKLQLDYEFYDNDFVFERLLDNEHNRDMDTYQCRNLHIEHNTITQHHHPLPEKIPPPMEGEYEGAKHIPILNYDDKVNFNKWGET